MSLRGLSTFKMGDGIGNSGNGNDNSNEEKYGGGDDLKVASIDW